MCTCTCSCLYPRLSLNVYRSVILSLQIIFPPITGVEDLVGQSKIRYGTVRDTGIETFFKNVTLKPYSELYPQMSLLGIILTDRHIPYRHFSLVSR